MEDKIWDYKVKCSVCKKLCIPRLPREGRLKGDGTVWFPRRHRIDSNDCEGNIIEGELIATKIENKTTKTDKDGE